MQDDLDDTILATQRPEGGQPSDTALLLDSVPTLGSGGPEADLEDTIVVRRHLAAAVVAPPAAAPAPTYRFRIGQTVVDLDRAACIGRKPSAPRIAHGLPPRLVRVPSPTSEVSSTHLEVRQRGGSVIVTDLRSTNGSTVHIPGTPPRLLRQGESMTVTPGTIVDIGDGILVEILPMQHR